MGTLATVEAPILLSDRTLNLQFTYADFTCLFQPGATQKRLGQSMGTQADWFEHFGDSRLYVVSLSL